MRGPRPTQPVHQGHTDWLHRSVGGLAPNEPGYRKLSIAPQPLPGLEWATTSHDTPYGRAAVAWRRNAGSIEITATVPANTKLPMTFPKSLADTPTRSDAQYPGIFSDAARPVRRARPRSGK